MDKSVTISHEVFAATECNNIFSGRQQRQGVKFLLGFRDDVSPWNFEEPLHLDAAVRTFTHWRSCPLLHTL